MIVLYFVPIVLSLLALGAHFLRSGQLVPLAAVLVVLLLLAVRRAWAARLAQLVLVLAAVEWVRTLVRIAGQRTRAGEPAGRMAMILGGVAALALASALLLQTRRMRRFYRAAETERGREG